MIIERRGHARIEIKNVDDFNDVVSDMFDEFLEDFRTREGLTRDWNEDDLFEEDEVQWMYTQAGMRLIDRYIKRMKKIGGKYFDEDDIELSSAKFIEP